MRMSSRPLLSYYTLAAVRMAAFIAMVPGQLDEYGNLLSITPDSGKMSSDVLIGKPGESEGMTVKY